MTHIMSEGITPYDFVQQVYYMQEKTLLDFWPSDDKYREVLVEANLVLRELEAQQDWTWLRDTVVLGDTSGGDSTIAQFVLPDDVYKISMLNHDSIRLYRAEDNGDGTYNIDDMFTVHVPFASAGDQRWNREKQYNGLAVNHIHDNQLRAVVHGHTIKLNRTLLPWETNFVAVVDVQKHITPFHVCDQTCWTGHKNSTHQGTDPDIHTGDLAKSTCSDASEKYLLEVPDPNYVIMATAARHAEGSPPALARVAGLQDAAQRILSQMRQNDSDATDSDYIEWDNFGYVEVI